MNAYRFLARRPRLVGVASAAAAVTLGLAYMAMAAAPVTYLAINAGAFVVGLAVLGIASSAAPRARRMTGAMTLAMAAGMLATALFGIEVEGAARWIAVGGLAVQPSLVVLPLMIVGFAVSRDGLARAGMIVAAAAIAIQPDRAMAAMLAAGLATIVATRADRFTLPAFAASVIGVAVTLMRPDSLPAMPFVDQIFYSSFDVHLVVGLAVVCGAVLLIVPAIVGWRTDPENRDVYLVFGAIWLTAILAAALGNYPTPLVGYSGAAVVGYVLSLAALPKVVRGRVGWDASRRAGPDRAHGSENTLNAGLARLA